jgi:hypothetical protein
MAYSGAFAESHLPAFSTFWKREFPGPVKWKQEWRMTEKSFALSIAACGGYEHSAVSLSKTTTMLRVRKTAPGRARMFV